MKGNCDDRKVIQQTIVQVRRKVKRFKKIYLGGSRNLDFVLCSQCLRDEILPAWNMSDVKDKEEFLDLAEMSEDVVFIDLISVAQRGQAFESLVAESKDLVLKCLQQYVYTCCSSLQEMTAAEDALLIAMADYENNICRYKSQMQEKIWQLEDNYCTYQQHLQPFSYFVQNGEEHTSTMKTVCNNLFQMCTILQNWLQEDDQYPAKLLQEFESNKKVRDNLKASLLQVQRTKEEKRAQIERLKKCEDRAGQNYTTHLVHKQRLKSTQLQLGEKQTKLSHSIQNSREQLHLLKAERQQGPMSPRKSQEYFDKLKALEENIESLDKWRMTKSGQLKAVEKTLKSVNDQTYESKVDAVTYRHRREELQKEMRNLQEEIVSLQKRLAEIESNNSLLMRIREMKLSSEFYRKCMREHKKRLTCQLSGSEYLTSACRYAAPIIASDWAKVYQALPFNPPRNWDKVQRDLEMMDAIAARNDMTAEEQAMKSLNKWRSLHRKATITELIQTLRDVNKQQLANDLEQQL